MISQDLNPATSVFLTRIRVRWNEMDANGHVNNMYYQSYFDEARISMLEEAGIDVAALRERNIGPVLFRAELDYRRELHHPDTITVSSWVSDRKKTRAVITQKIESDRTGS